MSYLFSSHPEAKTVWLPYMFLLFSPCLQYGRMRKCGFLGAWKKPTEMFLLQLDLVPRNIPESPGGQAEGLWAPRVSVSYPELRPQLKDWSTGRTDSPKVQFECWCTFLGQDLILQESAEAGRESEVITAGCIAKQPLTFHKPQPCISS